MSDTVETSDMKTNNLLWSWKFGAVDWLAVFTAPILLIANAALLFNIDPQFTQYRGVMFSLPWINIAIISGMLIVRPKSNSTRVPLVFLILGAACGVMLNIIYCGAFPPQAAG